MQIKVKVSATYFACSLNNDKIFAFAGLSPLYGAAESGSIEIVKLLLDRGADVNKVGTEGETFLVLLRLYWQIQLQFDTTVVYL